MFEFLIPFINYLVIGTLALLILYFKTLVSEKAKNRVLRGEIEELTRKTEQVKHEFKLDFEKRKHQYESKKTQYIHFFTILDQLSVESFEVAKTKFLEVVNSFNRNYLLAPPNKQNPSNLSKEATLLSKKITNILLETNKDQARLRQETSAIRLIASDSVIESINKLDNLYTSIYDRTSNMMTEFPKNMISGRTDKIKLNEAEIKLISNQIILLKNGLIQKMRDELNSI